MFHSFLMEEERKHVLTLAAPEMKRSTVVGGNGSGVVDGIRTSYGMFIPRLHDPIIEGIEKRISVFTHLPVSHQVGGGSLVCKRRAPSACLPACDAPHRRKTSKS